MSALHHREQLEQLRVRVEDELDAYALVTDDTDIPRLFVDLVAELGACVLELELNETVR